MVTALPRPGDLTLVDAIRLHVAMRTTCGRHHLDASPTETTCATIRAGVPLESYPDLSPSPPILSDPSPTCSHS